MIPIARRGTSGFTFTELLMTLAVSSIVFALAMRVLVYLSGEIAGLELGSLAANETALLVEYVTDKLMCAGGGSIRPWAAVAVEDDWQGDGSDRITVADLATAAWQCSVLEASGSTVTVDSPDGCCLSQDFVKRQVLLTTGSADNQSHWRTAVVENVDLEHCSAQLDTGTTSPLDHPPSGEVAWNGGTLAVVTVRSLWLNAATDELMLTEDKDRDGTLEDAVVANRVLDLQAALGYDVSPWDWRVTDGGSSDDEWLYNAPGERFQDSSTPGLETARPEDLRLVRVGVVVGAPTSSRSGQGVAKVLNGPLRSRSGWILRSFVGTTSLRNYDVMR